jgi:curved DNA-binding protein CbpA
MRTWSRREVLAFLDRVEPVLGGMDHFELLDVEPDAGDPAIQRAFHGMAAALHPDRHRRELTAEQHERLTIVYARIAEAYRVLRDPALRDGYLREAARQIAERETGAAPSGRTSDPLVARNQPIAPVGRTAAGTRPAAASTAPPMGDDGGLDEAAQLARISPKAQSLYRRAQAALRTGDRTSALLNLRMALAAHPTSTLIKDALARLAGKK